MAERTLLCAGHGLPAPADTPDAPAAAIGNAGLAAWLFSWRARLRPGETVMILGATGVTGSIAVTAVRRPGAGRVIAAGRQPDALARALAQGADAVVQLDRTDLSQACGEVAGAGVDAVVDYLNGSPAEAALGVMAHGGRMVQAGSDWRRASTCAQTARGASLDVLGFAYYHAPLTLQSEAYVELCQLAIVGEIKLGHKVSRAFIE